jgi:DUF1009 family protein
MLKWQDATSPCFSPRMEYFFRRVDCSHSANVGGIVISGVSMGFKKGSLKKMGLVSGAGTLPLEFVRNAPKLGIEEVAVLGFDKLTPDEVRERAAHYCEIGFGQLNKGIKFFKKHGVENMIMLGWMEPKLTISNIKMDFRMLALAARVKDRRADNVLKALIGELEKDGIKVLNTTDFLPHLLVEEGVLTKREPSKQQIEDIEFGREIALVSGGLDIGQTVVVRQNVVVALEAMEGTDNCLLRAGKYAKNCVVVKMAKPKQDFRFDVPCFGPRTIENAISAKIAVLAVEAGKTFILEREKTLELANAGRIAVIGINRSSS